VDKLLLEVSQRFSAHMGEEVSFVEVRTHDGYVISPKDIISDVIRDSDPLVVVDYKSWAKDQEQFLEQTWGSISRPDFAGGYLKWLQVGYHKHNKIYASCSLGKDIVHISVYDIVTMRKTQKPGNYQFFNFYGIDRDSYLPWNATVDLIVDCKDKKTYYLELQLKSGTDHQSLISRIELIDDGFKISAGRQTLIQKAFVDYKSDIPLPPPIIKGPMLTELIEKEKNFTDIKPFEGNKSEGDSPLQVFQIEKVYPDESWKRNDIIYNLFMVNVRVENSSGEQIYITDISSQYYVKDKWVDCEYSLIGEKYGFYDYSFSGAPYNVPVYGKDSLLLCLKAEIAIKDAPQYDKLRRVHQSLPYPLPLVFTITDNHHKTTKLKVLCYHHDPLKVITQQKKEKEEKIKYDWWFQCDDTICLNRLWLGVYIKDNQLNMVTQNKGRNLDEDELYKYAWTASKDKLKEISIEWPDTQKDDTQYITIDLLVDEKKPYALHFTLHTFTSHYEEWKLLPSL
jgi:hypothetical protein